MALVGGVSEVDVDVEQLLDVRIVEAEGLVL